MEERDIVSSSLSEGAVEREREKVEYRILSPLGEETRRLRKNSDFEYLFFFKYYMLF